METVFVAMSGGIDSSYSAYLLKQKGYNTVGFTFDLLPRSLRDRCNSKMCCSAASTNRARKVADSLSMRHYVINMRAEFEEHVIQRFIDEYRIGRTPNPCVLCNRYIKFASFIEKAIAMGADRVATGHYACVEETDRGFELKKGKDRAKDQSYFLYPIRYRDLRLISFPLAAHTKEMVRAGLATLDRTQGEVPESQDICFIPGNDYRAFIQQFVPSRKGPILATDGNRLGWHGGIHMYTIGQRRGINIPFKEPLYVVEIRPLDNALVVGPKEHLRRRSLTAEDPNMLSTSAAGNAWAKVRYRQREERCSYSITNGLLEIEFQEPISSVTPGQSVVLYDGETVLGGGTIR